jgi:hypothetical protein
MSNTQAIPQNCQIKVHLLLDFKWKLRLKEGEFQLKVYWPTCYIHTIIKEDSIQPGLGTNGG